LSAFHKTDVHVRTRACAWQQTIRDPLLEKHLLRTSGGHELHREPLIDRRSGCCQSWGVIICYLTCDVTSVCARVASRWSFSYKIHLYLSDRCDLFHTSAAESREKASLLSGRHINVVLSSIHLNFLALFSVSRDVSLRVAVSGVSSSRARKSNIPNPAFVFSQFVVWTDADRMWFVHFNTSLTFYLESLRCKWRAANTNEALSDDAVRRHLLLSSAHGAAEGGGDSSPLEWRQPIMPQRVGRHIY